jgi:hypothetical protein
MKNFKDLVSEVAQPKSPEEMRFKDQHTIELIRHPVAPDHVFTGEIAGKEDAKRPADKVNDEADYDKAYKNKVAQTLPQRAGAGKQVAKEEVEIKKSITEILGVNKKVKESDKKKDDSMEEETHMPSKSHVMDMCKDGLSFVEIKKMHPEADEDKLKAMVDMCMDELGESGCGGDRLNAEKHPKKKSDKKESEAADTLTQQPKPAPSQVTIKDSNGKTISLTFKEMLNKVSTEEELLESPQQEVPMMMRQLEFICYASNEIADYLGENVDPEEWWQNKLAEVFSNVKSLYAYAKGEQMVTGRPMGAAKIFAKAFGESIEAGKFDLENATSVEITEEDAALLNKMFEELTEINSKEMWKVMVADEAGYSEILEFAKNNL